MARTTYVDKTATTNEPAPNPANYWTAANANEIKASINEAYDAIELENTAWVGGGHGSADGVIGKQYKPFETIQQAINAIEGLDSSGTYMIRVAPGTGGDMAFDSGPKTIWVDSVTPVGNINMKGGTAHVVCPAGTGAISGDGGTLYVYGDAGAITATGATINVIGRAQGNISLTSGDINIDGLVNASEVS